MDKIDEVLRKVSDIITSQIEPNPQDEISSELKQAENISISDTTIRPRKDIFLFDYDCVNEAVLNALVHNDWTITEPQISMFKDRLEILSHGGLPRCTIPFEKEVLDQINSKNVGLNVGLNKTEKRVIEILIENSSVTSVELAEQIGVTKRTIERAFKSLQEKKMIERVGSKRDGNWIVVR